MRNAYALYWLAQRLALSLPAWLVNWLAERLADWHCHRSPQDRLAVRDNLTDLLNTPLVDEAPEVREVFRHFARYLSEFLCAHAVRASRWVIEGQDRAVQMLQRHRPSIILSAHLGNWELGAILLSRLGIPVSIVALPHQDVRVNRLFNFQRRRCGVGVIPLGVGATQRCFKALRAGRAVALVGDREFNMNGLPVSFLGHDIVMPKGPAVVSLRTGAPLILVCLVREGPSHFRFHVEEPIWPPARPHTAAHVKQLTQECVTRLERVIRRYPLQWLMFRPLPTIAGDRAQEPDVPSRVNASDPHVSVSS